MVTVDLRCKLQAEKCPDHGDMCAHLNKLQMMRKDLALMGASIADEDFTLIILGSILPLYDTYIYCYHNCYIYSIKSSPHTDQSY